MPPAAHATKTSAARGGGRGRRRRGHGGGEEEGGSERWLVTYADLLTVLLALFIVLFAISALNESKFQQLKYSLAAVFGDGSIGVFDGSPALNSANDNSVAQPPTVPEMPRTDNPYIPALPNTGGLPTDNSGVAKENAGINKPASATINTGDPTLDKKITAELNDFEKVRIEIDQHLDAAGLTGAAQYSIDQRGLIVTIVTDALIFPGNNATLLPRGQKLLAAIAPAVKKVPNNVEVDGFTNQVDVSTYPYPSGWELSSARASSVVRYLESHGLNDRQLSAVGFSDQKPLVPPSNPLSITRNRRVEIVVLSTLPSLAGDTLKQAADARDKAAAGAANSAATNAKPGSSSAAIATGKLAATSGANPGTVQPPTGQAARGNQPPVTIPATTPTGNSALTASSGARGATADVPTTAITSQSR
ncbi:MAG: flagellar motor protein MotB [Nakamurella sp.]